MVRLGSSSAHQITPSSMEMETKLAFRLPLFFFFFGAVVLSAQDASIHDLLRRHGLPSGLLPKGVRSFHFDEATGYLEVNLDEPCYARYDSMTFFDQVVRGNLSYGELRGLVGLAEEELFLWLPVKGIVVSGASSGVILLDIGVAQKQLSFSLFDNPPDCLPVLSNRLEIGPWKWKGRAWW